MIALELWSGERPPLFVVRAGDAADLEVTAAAVGLGTVTRKGDQR